MFSIPTITSTSPVLRRGRSDCVQSAVHFRGFEIAHKIHVVMYIFGFLLIFAAIKTMFEEGGGKQNRHFPVQTSERFSGTGRTNSSPTGWGARSPAFNLYHRNRVHGYRSRDSIPAVLSITTDKFIVYSSNIFAVLGLRSLYFALRGS